MTIKLKPLRLWQEIALALTLKAMLLTLIWATWFSGAQDTPTGAQQAAAHIILAPQSTKEQSRDADSRAR